MKDFKIYYRFIGWKSVPVKVLKFNIDTNKTLIQLASIKLILNSIHISDFNIF
jgi:hypothetical protein